MQQMAEDLHKAGEVEFVKEGFQVPGPTIQAIKGSNGNGVDRESHEET